VSAFAGPGVRCPHEGCRAVFAKARNLDEHLERIHRWRDGVAPANAQLDSPATKETAMPRTYQCVECDPPTEFGSFDERAEHVRAEHFPVAEPELKPAPFMAPAARPHVCPDCDRSFVALKGLVAHQASAHSTDGPVFCDGCEKDFANERTFKRHRTMGHCRPSVARQVGDLVERIRPVALAPPPIRVSPDPGQPTSSIPACIEILTSERARLLEQLARVDTALAALAGALPKGA
jgi:hypothetical protein